MSEIRVDQLKNSEGTGSPLFPYGLNVTGVVTATTFSGNATSATSATTAGSATTASFATTSFGLSGSPIIEISGANIAGVGTIRDIRVQSIGEKSTISLGNTVSLVYNTGGGNVAICSNPTGDITLNITGIPVDSSFDNTVLTFSVVVTNTGTARSCTAVNLNGVSKTIKWFGGSLANAITGVTTTIGYDIYSFSGINTVGSASTTTNYVVLGSVNGSYR
jgi:hypothetical protein